MPSASRTLAPRPPVKSPPTWLAADPEAQRLLGTCHRDPDGVVWQVRALDTSEGGDIARLSRLGNVIQYRTVLVSELDRKYARMEISP
jgi:hypothetical protein